MNSNEGNRGLFWNTLLSRRRKGLMTVVAIWIGLYFLSEFPTKAYENGGGLVETVQLLFNAICFLTCFVLAAISVFRRRFSYRSDSFILLMLLSVKAIFGSAIAYADLGIKAIVFSAAPGLCQSTGSEYLNRVGFKLCYSWAHYPEARFIVLSPIIDLTKSIDSWPSEFITELGSEKTKYNFIATCGYREVHWSLSSTYFIRSYCQ